MVVKTAKQQGVLESLHYRGPNDNVEMAALGNIVKYHPRRDDSVLCSVKKKKTARRPENTEGDEEEDGRLTMG